MPVSYIYRVDDISWDMNMHNFYRIKDMLIRHNVRPIIGVIPANEDPLLKEYAGTDRISPGEFWAMIYNLQDQYGWDVALHGYNHVYTNENSGLLKINNFSEFAGLDYALQKEKIELGKQVLQDHNLIISAFMAPGHSFDMNTVLACRDANINCITDGISLYPYVKNGVLFIPQYNSGRIDLHVGIRTVCIHPNCMVEEEFVTLEQHILRNLNNISTFRAIQESYQFRWYHVPLNSFAMLYQNLRRLTNVIRRCLL